ncbi:antitoxin Xre/MbcA/ParS toxin-binding domain-containing protein [Phnomibacter sp. MR]|uniref:type II RES/Xre toxin-antitoxin system antitoxin n=1 Tax=Phnomibacter sp. MR TaxID=3042318 RepID=UPI003A80E506
MDSSITGIEKKLNKEISFILTEEEKNRGSKSARTTISYNDFLSNKMLMIQVIRKGVPYSLFHLIQSYTPFTEEDWAAFLDISTKSLQRYRSASKVFRPIQSEKIIELAEVTKVGMDVFGDLEKFRLWLETPNYALGSLKPVELLKDSYGKEMVLGELVRINYGIFA